tara:strand:+ start:363 stop:587 length:225 start_codon:yes stop_codon:yes gene_type:complete
MIIPPNELSDETLQSVVQDCILRGPDGTENLSEDTLRTVHVIRKGELLLMYSEETETVGLISKEDFEKNAVNKP